MELWTPPKPALVFPRAFYERPLGRYVPVFPGAAESARLRALAGFGNQSGPVTIACRVLADGSLGEILAALQRHSYDFPPLAWREQTPWMWFTSVVYNTGGTTSITVPSDWNTGTNTVGVWGPGGGGGGANGSGGGGGGAFAQNSNDASSPCAVVTCNISAGGTAGTGSAGIGTDTYWISAATLMAKAGGQAGISNFAGGSGGSGSSSVGTYKGSGGSGGGGGNTIVGGGGSAIQGGGGGGGSGHDGNGTGGGTGTATNGGNGGNGDNPSGGTGPTGGTGAAIVGPDNALGGAGASGAAGANSGAHGGTPGGGGSGSGLTGSLGGPGAPGQITLTYTPVTPGAAHVPPRPKLVRH